MRASFVLVSLAILPGGCATIDDAPTSAADESAILALVDRFASGFVAGDPELVTRCVTADFVAMAPGEPAIEGREAVQAKIAQDLKLMEVHELVFEVGELQVAGEWAWARATSRAEVVLRESGAVGHLRGKTLWVFRRGVDGAWRIARDASSADDA